VLIATFGLSLIEDLAFGIIDAAGGGARAIDA
jgi:hypothetical protein